MEAQKLEKTINEEKAAKQKIQKDMVNQKDRLQQRLAERRRSVAMRANSQVNQTLPLNFEHSAKQTLQGEGDISPLNSLQVPMMRTSAMSKEESPMKKSTTLRLNNKRDDDIFSQGNRSTTTQGGGLANKIGQAVSRILSQSQAAIGEEC